MKDSAYKISLDINEHGSQVVLKAKKTDTGRKIYISLRAGGTPYTIEEDCYAVFTATKPDGSILYNACTIENNEIVYEFTEQTCAAIGRNRCEIKLYGLDEKLITSPRFALLVEGTVYPDEVVESSDEFSALTQMVSDALEAKKGANEAADNANEATKNANEAAVVATNASNNANLATENANTATFNANTATQNATLATNNANTATDSAKDATAKAILATENANTAAGNANDASANANQAAKNANESAFKAAHTAKSLMVVGEAKGEIIPLNDAINQYLVGLRVFGKTTQDGTPTPDAPVELDSTGDVGSISVNVAGKNLLPNEASSQIINGLTVTVNSDKSITFNGTAEKQTTLILKAGRGWINGGNYVGTGCPVGGGATKYYIRFGDSIKSYDDNGAGVAVSFAEDSHCYAQITIMSGVNVSNLTFHPMLRCAYTTDSTYVPYKEVMALSIATPNGLPGIPVTSGGNYTDANGQHWICDEIDFAGGVYVQRVNTLAFDGTEMWFPAASNFDNCVAFNYNVNGKHTANGAWTTVVSNIAPTMTAAEYTTKDVNGVGGYGVAVTFKILKTILKSNAETNEDALDEWSSYLSSRFADGTPLTVQYILATPIETSLSEEELAAYANLHTYKDSTTVSNDAGAWMELEYVMDAKKYIDSLVVTGGSIIPATVE